MSKTISLTHRCLIAPPDMADEVFAHTVIYLARHDEEGAQASSSTALQDFRSKNCSMILKLKPITYDHTMFSKGGPFASRSWLCLTYGSADAGTLPFAVGENICITTSKDILDAIAHNEGVGRYQIALGYTSWTKSTGR